MAPYSYLVLGVNPVSNEMNVDLSSKITVTFAKHINTDTLNSNTIRLRKVNGDFIEYTGRYLNIDKVYEVTPKEPLEASTQYQIMVVGGTDGVIAIDGSYLPSTKTYEFVTVQREGVTSIENLVLKQDYLFVSAQWDMPKGLVDGEEIYFNVRLSTSSNPEAYDVWPTNLLEGKTTTPNITIPQRLEAGRNYYVHVQAVTTGVIVPKEATIVIASRLGESTANIYNDDLKKTEWVTSQIYIEPIEQTTSSPVEESPSTNVQPEVVSAMGQLGIVDYFPQNGEFQKPSEIVVVFNDAISPDLFNDTTDSSSLFYVVEAPYKETLSLIDLRGLYSVKNAINGKSSIDSENSNVLVWVPDAGTTAFKEGKSYTVIVSKNITGENTLALGSNYVFGFVGTPEHLHGEIDQIKEVLSSLNVEPSTRFLQSLMRKYSQYACDIWYNTSTYDEALHQNGEAPYYIHQYVNTQVTIDALLHGGIMASGGGDETVTLGELTVIKSGGSSGSTTSISDVITQLQSEIKTWEDLIHGHHNRGYAVPGNVVKGENVQTLPTFVTRTTMNTSFDAS
ncbi:Ig-like domain-containing protein [Priestia sp. YIM B13551]|uniref:Ig-like domain-containing protein n=1 Tax=Priestia sp. YIM B13551 TaxID=3366306 RepID=UPI00366AD001